jgi:hypothetical protein
VKKRWSGQKRLRICQKPASRTTGQRPIFNQQQRTNQFMATLTKKMLTLSIASFIIGLIFVTGIINVQSAADSYVFLPLGAVFFGLFLIFKMLEKEAALYDDEHPLHPAPRTMAATVNEQPKNGGYSMPGRHGSHATR